MKFFETRNIQGKKDEFKRGKIPKQKPSYFYILFINGFLLQTIMFGNNVWNLLMKSES